MKRLVKWTRLDKALERWNGLNLSPSAEELSQFIRYDGLNLYAKNLKFIDRDMLKKIANQVSDKKHGWGVHHLAAIQSHLAPTNEEFIQIELLHDLSHSKDLKVTNSSGGMYFESTSEVPVIEAHAFKPKISHEGIPIIAPNNDLEVNENLKRSLKYIFATECGVIDERNLYFERDNLMWFEQKHFDIQHGLEINALETGDKQLHQKERDSYLKFIRAMLLEVGSSSKKGWAEMLESLPQKSIVASSENIERGSLGKTKVASIYRELKDF
jgi:hypothetical protein